MCIFGATSSGKTYMAGHLFASLPNWNIFFNTQFEPVLHKKFGGYEVTGISALTKALEDKHRRIVYTPHSETPQGQQAELSEIIDILFAMGRIFNTKGDRVIWCHLYVDEVHLLSPKKAPFDRLDRVATQGKRFGVIGVFISQRPALVSQTLITQSDKQIIYRCNTYEIPYFERYGYPIADHFDWLDQDYHFILDDGRKITRMNPIKV